MHIAKILIADDDEVSIRLLKQKLGRTATILSCSSAEEFREALTCSPGVILMDIQLGHAEQGFSLIEWYREQHGTAQGIFILSFEITGVLSRVYYCGGNDCISKPVKGDILESKILGALVWKILDSI